MPEVLPPQSDQPPRVSADASGDRSVALGRDANAPIITGDIVNSDVTFTTDVNVALPPAQRTELRAILLIGVITLIIISVLVFRNSPSVPEADLPATPASQEFAFVPSSNAMGVTALAVDGDSLWIGAQAAGAPALYRLNSSRADAALERIPITIENQILDLLVDCQGNVWLLIDEVGARVYRPLTGEYSAAFNKQTTANWLAKNTSYAIATRCLSDGSVEVWLGRTGVRTLRYRGDYPAPDLTTQVSPDSDIVYRNSQNLPDVRALSYVTPTKMLWIAAGNQLLATTTEDDHRRSTAVSTVDPALQSISPASGDAVWSCGIRNLFSVSASAALTVTLPYEFRSCVIAAGSPWLWLGQQCAAQDSACYPLWVYGQSMPGGFVPLTYHAIREVRAIVIDPQERVWIGTEQGLFVYASTN